jgi:ketosteroid isomerase-like protein
LTPTDLIDSYLDAVANPSTEDATLDALLHPDYRFVERPNALNPPGSDRNRDAALEGIKMGRTLLEFQRFDVHEHLEHGDLVVSRMTWNGRLARDVGPLKAGTSLRAHVSQHTTIRDGRVWRTESFDCYEPVR